MKKKRRDDICHALEFAKAFSKDTDWIQDLKDCEKFMKQYANIFIRDGLIKDVGETQKFARLAFMLHRWCKYRQCYSITRELAEDLFAMEDLSFPIEALHLPFPCFFLDMEALGESIGDDMDARLLGYYIMVEEIPYGNVIASCCNIAVLGIQKSGFYTYGAISFDYDPDFMEQDLKSTVESLCRNYPDSRKHITRALLFAAYLSSEQPDLSENPAQKAIYHPSEKLRFSSVKKWDVGVRYMAEKRKRTALNAEAAKSVTKVDDTVKADGTTKRTSPRPHIRKAHWQTYRTGHGRTGKKILWIAPITVGLQQGKSPDNPTVVRELKGDARRE